MNNKPNSKYTKQELNRTARSFAQWAYDDFCHLHRGVFPLHDGIYVFFGNDCYKTDQRSRAEAGAVMQAALARGCNISNIQTSRDGQTWSLAVVCKRSTAKALEQVMNKTWFAESMKKSMASVPTAA